MGVVKKVRHSFEIGLSPLSPSEVEGLTRQVRRPLKLLGVVSLLIMFSAVFLVGWYYLSGYKLSPYLSCAAFASLLLFIIFDWRLSILFSSLSAITLQAWLIISPPFGFPGSWPTEWLTYFLPWASVVAPAVVLFSLSHRFLSPRLKAAHYLQPALLTAENIRKLSASSVSAFYIEEVKKQGRSLTNIEVKLLREYLTDLASS